MVTRPARPRGVRALAGRALILAIVAAGVWYALDRIDWGRLWTALRAADPWWICAGVAATLLSHLVRAERWRLLITDGHAIPLLHAFRTTLVGYMFNNVIPRSGELVRPWALARRAGRPLSTMIASIVVERIIDGLSLAAIVGVLAITSAELLTRLLPEYTAGTLVLAVAVPVVGLVVLAFLALRTSIGDRLIDLVAPRLSERLVTRVRSMLVGFRSGVSFSGRWTGVLIALESVVIWAGYAAGTWCAILAFGFDVTYGLGLHATLVTLAITSIAITIAPTPGGFIVFHSFCIAVLTGVFGVAQPEAAAFALASHGATYLAVTVIGGFLAVMEDISFGVAVRGLPAASARPPADPKP